MSDVIKWLLTAAAIVIVIMLERAAIKDYVESAIMRSKTTTIAATARAIAETDIAVVKYMLDEGAYPPVKAHDEKDEWDSGWDLKTPFDFVLNPGESIFINTGVHTFYPVGWDGRVASKSGLFRHRGILTTGVVDMGYTDPVGVTMYNIGKQVQAFKRGDKIAQLLVQKCHKTYLQPTYKVPKTRRGSNGYGSSGR